MSSAGDPAKVLKLHPAAASGEGEESARVRAGKAGKKKRKEHEIHPVLGRQLMEAADQNGKLQVRKLIEIVSRRRLAPDHPFWCAASLLLRNRTATGKLASRR